MQKMTLEKIAKQVGVSKVAVFNALNNKKGVSDNLRKQIIEYANTNGYINKSSLVDAKNKKFIFFINQDFFLTPSEQFYSAIFYFLSAECNKVGCLLQIAFIEKDKTIDKMSEVINSFKPNGLFIAGEVDKSILKFIDKCNIPSVFIDYYSPLYDFNFVYVDNYHLSYSLTKFLIANGHKKIGFIGDIKKTTSIADRYFGYQKALSEDNMSNNEKWHININLEKNEEILEINDNLPTAFLCHCDAAAQRIYTVLSLRGLKVPEDISIVSFDNTPLCDNLSPKLTSAGPQKDYYAKKAFNTMIESLNKNKSIKTIIKTNLVERESVKTI